MPVMTTIELTDQELDALSELIGALAEDCQAQDCELDDDYVAIYAKVGTAQLAALPIQ